MPYGATEEGRASAARGAFAAKDAERSRLVHESKAIVPRAEAGERHLSVGKLAKTCIFGAL